MVRGGMLFAKWVCSGMRKRVKLTRDDHSMVGDFVRAAGIAEAEDELPSTEVFVVIKLSDVSLLLSLLG